MQISVSNARERPADFLCKMTKKNHPLRLEDGFIRFVSEIVFECRFPY